MSALGQKADIEAHLPHVRFIPDSGHGLARYRDVRFVPQADINHPSRGGDAINHQRLLHN
jgi:hypothetical protein